MTLTSSVRWWFAQATSLPLTEPAAPPRRPLVQPPAPPAHGGKPSPHRSSGLWMLLPVLLGALVAYVGYRQWQETSTVTPAGEAFRTARVVKGDFTQNLRVSGTITAKLFAAIVAPQMSGRSESGSRSLVLTKMAAAGSVVRKGDIVAEFDRQNLDDRMYRLRADVVEAQANLEKSRAELAIELETSRQEMRMAEGAAGKAKLDLRTAEVRSQIEADLLRLAAQQTEAEFQQKKQEVALLEKSHQAELRALELVVHQAALEERRGQINADRMVIRTPIDGTVVMMTTFRGGGQFSQVGLGDELRPGTYFMQIVDPSNMVLEASFNQADSQRLRVGHKAEVSLDAYPGESWPGRIVSIGASTAAGGAGMRGSLAGSGDYVRNVPVIVALEDGDKKIIPDLSGSADVVLNTEEDALMVPREVVVHENGEAVVYLPGDKQPRRQKVVLGARSDTHYVVLDGLSEGETLLVSPPSATRLANAIEINR